MSNQTINGTPQNIEKVSKLFKVLGDPTRLKILTLLFASELNVGAIAQTLELEQSAVSHQLKVLRDNRLVDSRKEGKSVYYFLDDKHVTDILAETFTHAEHSQF